jgi:serine/threonine protein kinase/tetratricopeptide (TPR) repeat protein
MVDPDRTQSDANVEAEKDDTTLASADGATLMPPSEKSDDSLSQTIPLPRDGDDVSQTLALPIESESVTAQTLAVGPDVPGPLAPPTVAPPRFDHPMTADTLAPPEELSGAVESTERLQQLTNPPNPIPESSGTLLDAHLISEQSGRITEPAPPVIPRVTAPAAAPLSPSAPSTIARPAAIKTGAMPALKLPNVDGYEILRELGRGGMGVVYEARQKGLNRIVALKMVLAAGRASADEVARFRAEAEAVAHLHHPNIVQVYDTGTHQGMPYFSLEFCPGGTLSDRTSGKPLAPRLAARIVRDLAHAVHYAHQRLILHRDLKPANVLLATPDATTLERLVKSSERKTRKIDPTSRLKADQDKTTVPAAAAHRAGGPPPSRDRVDVDLEHCVPKITDFGLAKRLEGDAGKTRDGSVMGTPSYMAPEQAQGKVRELGPPADVYALGAILYDLLTGSPPFHGDTVMDTLNQVINAEPVAVRRKHAHVPVDLDTICLKCLEKDPAKRYASADALAEDLRRFLDQEPILARPTPWWERTAKWARRRPARALAAAGAVAAAVAFCIGGYVWARQEADRAATEASLREVAVTEKNEADSQRERAEQLKTLAEEHFLKACAAVNALLAQVGHVRLAHEPHMEQIRRELLQKAAMFYEGFLRERGDDPHLRWQTARTQKNLGDIQEMLGNLDQAEQRYRTAVTMFVELRDSAPDDVRIKRDLAATQNNLGLLLDEMTRPAEAERALSAARDLRRSLLEQSNSDESRSDLAATDHAFGLLLERRGDLAGAEAAFTAALEQQQKITYTTDDQGIKAWRELARINNSLGRVAEAGHRTKDADRHFGDAKAILVRVAADAPKTPEVLQELGQTYVNLGRLHRDTDPAAAEKDYMEAVQVADRLVEDFPATPAYRQDLAAALNNLGVLLLATGRSAEADKAFSRALSLKERLAAEIHWVADYRRDFGAGLNNRGIQLKTHGRGADADKVFNRAVNVLTDLVQEHGDVPAYQRELAGTLVNRALVAQSDGKLSEAEALLRRALTIQQKLAGRADALPELRGEQHRTRIALGTLYQLVAAARPAEQSRETLARAESEYRAAIEGYKDLAGRYPKEPDFQYQQALAASALASLLSGRKQTAEAKANWDQAAGLLQALAVQHPDVPGYAVDLGRSLNNQGLHSAMSSDLKDASEIWTRAAAALTETVRLHPKEEAAREELAKVSNNQAILALSANRLDDATALYRQAVAALDELPADVPRPADYRYALMNANRNLAEQLASTGHGADAEAAWRRSLETGKVLCQQAPNDPRYASDLGLTEAGLAAALVEQNRAANARSLAEQACTVQRSALKQTGAPSCKDRLTKHLNLLKEIDLQLGDHMAAASTVDELVALSPADGSGAPVAAAAGLARCAALAAADNKLPEDKRRETAQAYADRSMSHLQAAVKNGFKDWGELKKKDFDALRQRDDFRSLLKQSES